jgi:DNA-binding HxlR family transcriptional regulator
MPRHPQSGSIDRTVTVTGKDRLARTPARAAGRQERRATRGRTAPPRGGSTPSLPPARPQGAWPPAPKLPSGAPTLDHLIHGRLRLGIVTALAVNESLTFNDLKYLLGTTDGNLSVHARKLEQAGYITCTKYFDGRLPKTEYRLTPSGRAALEGYLDYMESLIRATRGSPGP